MADLNLDIFTPSKLAYSAGVKAVTIPGTVGSFQVLHNHAPIISTFELGAIKVIVDDNNTIFFATSGGTVEVLDNKVKIQEIRNNARQTVLDNYDIRELLNQQANFLYNIAKR